MVSVERDLAPGEWSVLALLAEQPGHGWVLARQMTRTGDIGAVWSLGRPLVYRALELLDALGRDELERWLAEPVDHVRDVRSTFLLKLILIDRAGLDPEPLLEAQRASVV